LVSNVVFCFYGVIMWRS